MYDFVWPYCKMVCHIEEKQYRPNDACRADAHQKKKGKVTIPFHSKDIPKKTENSIRKQAGLR